MSLDTLKSGFYNVAKKHIVDSTALLACSHPIFAAYETHVAGMTDEVSFGARLTVTIMTYCGLGYVIGKVRDKSRKLFKITDKTKERYQQIHDSLYLAAINIPLSLGVYSIAGETNLKNIAVGTGMSILYGFVLGGWTGYSLDAYNDLAGIRENERSSYPKILKERSPKVKKMLAVGFTALSIAATIGVYATTSDAPKKISEPAVLEKRLNVTECAGLDRLLTI